MNPNCDGGKCRSTTGEVRVYPLGAGGNLILCADCWRHQNAYHVSRGDRERWPTEDWASAKPYPDPADKPLPGWNPVSKERYYEMLGAVPPLMHTPSGFLLGEAATHTPQGVPAYRAFLLHGNRYYENEKPLTVDGFMVARSIWRSDA